jgi:hypothetical protein
VVYLIEPVVSLLRSAGVTNVTWVWSPDASRLSYARGVAAARYLR